MASPFHGLTGSDRESLVIGRFCQAVLLMRFADVLAGRSMASTNVRMTGAIIDWLDTAHLHGVDARFNIDIYVEQIRELMDEVACTTGKAEHLFSTMNARIAQYHGEEVWGA